MAKARTIQVYDTRINVLLNKDHHGSMGTIEQSKF